MNTHNICLWYNVSTFEVAKLGVNKHATNEMSRDGTANYLHFTNAIDISYGISWICDSQTASICFIRVLWKMKKWTLLPNDKFIILGDEKYFNRRAR